MPRVAIWPDDDVAVAIEHQARQPVGLAEHEPVVRLARQPLAQRQRHVQPMDDERTVERLLRRRARRCARR